MRNDDLYILDQRTERRITVTIAVGLLCIVSAVLSVQCGKTAPPPDWPPPAPVVEALPAMVTATVADFATVATPAADPSPVTADAL